MTTLKQIYDSIYFIHMTPPFETFEEAVEQLPMALLTLPDEMSISCLYYSDNAVWFGANSGRVFQMFDEGTWGQSQYDRTKHPLLYCRAAIQPLATLFDYIKETFEDIK